VELKTEKMRDLERNEGGGEGKKKDSNTHTHTETPLLSNKQPSKRKKPKRTK
jgi:hypothetical protein